MKTTLKFCGIICALISILFISGCVSNMVGRSAGGDLIWWCDKCQCQVGHPSTHICGKTKYDYATKKDVPMEGVTNNEIEELLRKDRERRNKRHTSSTYSTDAQEGGSKWKFWRRSGASSEAPAEETESVNRRSVREPYWQQQQQEQSAPVDNESVYIRNNQPASSGNAQGSSKWKFWRKGGNTTEQKPPVTEETQAKSKWKFWQR